MAAGAALAKDKSGVLARQNDLIGEMEKDLQVIPALRKEKVALAQEVQDLSFTATVDVSCKLSAPAMRPVLRLACESSAGVKSTRAVRADASETDVWRMAEGEVCRQVE